MSLMIYTVIAFYDDFTNNHTLYDPYIIFGASCICAIFNIFGILYCHYTDKVKDSWFHKLTQHHKHPWFKSKSDVLRFSFSFAIIGYIFSIWFVFNNISNFYTLFVQPLTLVLLISSISAVYYIKHPIYINPKLSVTNLRQTTHVSISIRWSDGILSIISFALYAFIFLELILAYIVYVISISGAAHTHIKSTKRVHGVIKRRVHGVIKRVNKTELLKLSNRKSLKDLEPVLNNFCNKIFIIIFIVLFIALICIMTRSFIYSVRNNISKYRLIRFISGVTFYVFRYAVVTIPSIILMDKIINHFIKYPLALNGKMATIILLFFPFMGFILFTLYV